MSSASSPSAPSPTPSSTITPTDRPRADSRWRRRRARPAPRSRWAGSAVETFPMSPPRTQRAYDAESPLVYLSSCNSSPDCFWPTASRISFRGSAATGSRRPFASPPGVGESSPVVNVLWGFLNLAIGFALLFAFAPKGRGRRARMGVRGARRALIALFCAWHFGRVRSRRASVAESGAVFARIRESE